MPKRQSPGTNSSFLAFEIQRTGCLPISQARQSNPAHFSPITGRFAIREAQAAGTVSTSISGGVADTCRGGIDMFSFPDCRHSLGGAASPRLISPAASVYAVSRDVEVIVVRVGLIVAPGLQAMSFAPL